MFFMIFSLFFFLSPRCPHSFHSTTTYFLFILSYPFLILSFSRSHDHSVILDNSVYLGNGTRGFLSRTQDPMDPCHMFMVFPLFSSKSQMPTLFLFNHDILLFILSHLSPLSYLSQGHMITWSYQTTQFIQSTSGREVLIYSGPVRVCKPVSHPDKSFSTSIHSFANSTNPNMANTSSTDDGGSMF